MKKSLTLSIVIILGTIMVNCSSTKTATGPKISPVETVADINRNFTEAQFQEGKRIAEASCVKCHGFKAPETRTVTKLEKVLPPMFKKAHLTAQQSELVRAYMLSRARIE